MHVDRAEIVAILRSRGLGDRADWVDRTLTEIVDTDQNAGLLRTLNIDPTSLAPAGAAPQPS